MNADSLSRAIDEASRFIERAKRLLSAHRKAERRREHPEEYVLSPITGSAQSGAVKRASMDLTRALADLRRPG